MVQQHLAKTFVGAIVRTDENKILCQLRDDKPEIIFPGCWTCSPGGTVESGEEPEQAIKREMAEEFEIEIKDIQRLLTFNLKTKFPGVYHIFTAQIMTPTSLAKCNEGQRIDFFSIAEALKLRQHSLNLEILNYYLKIQTSQKPGEFPLDISI